MLSMKRIYGTLVLLMFMVGILVMGSVQDANALFVLTLDDLNTAGIDIIVADGAPVGTPTKKGPTNIADGSAVAGVINYNGPAGVFTTNVTTGISKPVIGGPGRARIDLNSVDVSGGAGQLEIELTDTDFLLPVPPNSYILTSEIGGTTDGTVDFDQFIDLSNNEFGIGPPAPNIPLVLSMGTFGPGAFSGTTSGSINIVNPFSITEEVLITHTAAGQITSFDALSDAAIPEPSTLLLLGFGALGFIGYGLRRRRRVK